MLVMKKPAKPKTKTWAPTIEDAKLMDELKDRLGKRLGLSTVNDSDIVRMGLRALAEKEARATNG